MKRGIITQKGKAEDENRKRENEPDSRNCNEVCRLLLFKKKLAQNVGDLVQIRMQFLGVSSYSGDSTEGYYSSIERNSGRVAGCFLRCKSGMAAAKLVFSNRLG